MPFGLFPYIIYPRIYKVSDVIDVVYHQNNTEGENCPVNWGFYLNEENNAILKPKVIPARLDKITENDAYIMDNGEYINLFISKNTSNDFILNVSN
jgi:hypothetical protein